MVILKTFIIDNVIPIDTSLRARPDDVPLLADHFLRIYAEKNNRHFDGMFEKPCHGS